jgi:hypothetical protein
MRLSLLPTIRYFSAASRSYFSVEDLVLPKINNIKHQTYTRRFVGPSSRAI